MSIEFSCPGCGKQMRAPEASAGKQGKCPQCGTQMTIPEPAAPAPAPSSASAEGGTIEFSCGSCGKLMRTPASAAGKKGKCPACGQINSIPAAGGDSASSTSSASSTPRESAKPAPSGPIEFYCPGCGSLVKTPGSAAGKKGKCPHCDAVVDIPTQSARKPQRPPPSSGLTPLPGAGLTPVNPGLTPIGGGVPAAGAGLTPLPSPGLTPLPDAGLSPLPSAGLTPLPGAGGGLDDLLGPAAGLGAPGGYPGGYPGGPLGGYPPGGGGYAPMPGFDAVAPNPYATPAFVPQSRPRYTSSKPNDSGRPGLPWEQRDADSALLGTAKLVILQPSEGFDQMRRTGGMGNSLTYLMATTIISSASTAVYGLLFNFVIFGIGVMSRPELMDRFGPFMAYAFIRFGFELVGAIVGGAIGACLGFFLNGAIFHLMLMIVGGARYGFETTAKVVGYAMGSNQLWTVVPCVGGFIMLVTLPISLIIGLARAHETDGWRAALAVFLPLILCCAAALALIFGTGVLAGFGGLMRSSRGY